jgi:dihydrofolate reductase
VRRIRYQVAASLDGYIAGPNGEADWIIMDPDIDFAALFNQFDTFLMGRGTFDGMVRQGGSAATPGMKTLVFSRTLQQRDHPDVTIVADIEEKTLAALKEAPGKDIWLFGGGSLFRSLLEMGLVDTVEVAVIPVLLGGGIPLLPPPAPQTKLKLTGHRVFKTGIVLLEYTIEYARRRKATTKRKARTTP